MTDDMRILESCDVVDEQVDALPDRWVVRMRQGQPIKVVTPEGQEGPLIRISYPLPEAARQALLSEASHLLMDRPDALGLVAVDASGTVHGVAPAERLRELIVETMDAEEAAIEQMLADELGIDREHVKGALGMLGSLRGGIGYTPGPPGDPTPPVTQFVCPVEGCDTPGFVPHQEGVPIPPCGEHHCALVPKTLGTKAEGG